MARQFSHLKEIADEIPPYDPKASVEILIVRDAPELLKIRASRNGPKGAPWTQKQDLGWTISGQMCLDRVGGPVHISAHRTSLERLDRLVTSYPRNVQASHHYAEESEIVPCPNHFEVKERYAEKGEIGDNLFESTLGRQQFGQHVSRRQTLPGDGDSQEPTRKLGDAAAVSLAYRLDA